MNMFSRRRVLRALPAVAFAPAIIGCEGKGTRIVRPPKDGLATINGRLAARAAEDGDGAKLHRLFPAQGVPHLDPFVLFDDFDVTEPAGFPEHPHRGFEAFTYMITGAFHHKDNLGNDSEIGVGGTQRFNSGRGARHSEMPGPGTSNRGMQLWVNLVADKKQMAPEYEGIAGKDMPVVERPDHRMRIVAGKDSPVGLHTEVDILDLELLADTRFSREIAAGHGGCVYVLDGAVTLQGERLEHRGAAILGPGAVELSGNAGARIMWLAGRPHGQPIRHRGPFVD
jgi:redox-sensitive bicupin YhaK (pirin superfamily)